MKYLIYLTLAILCLISIYPEIDLKFSEFFYSEDTGHFIYRDNILLSVFSFFVNLLFVFVSLTVGSLFIYPVFKAKMGLTIPVFDSVFERHFSNKRKAIALAFLTIIISPVILVNFTGKPLWDRARPFEVEQFSGDKIFTPFYKPFAGQSGDSFPSGHTSRSASLIALSFLFAVGAARRNILCLTVLFTISAGFVRIFQGNHYLSDVTMSLFITLLVIKLLERFLLKTNEN